LSVLTTETFFSAIAQGTSSQWFNEENVLQDSLQGVFNPSSPILVDRPLRVDGPICGSEVPPSAIIDRIIITFDGNNDQGGNNANWLREIGIEDGTVFPDLEKWSGGIEVYDGDLTYWGLTQQQARDFAIGNLHFNISGYAQGTDSNNTYIDWFKCQFGYSFAPPDQVAYPGPIF
jgi:hypothetical protein